MSEGRPAFYALAPGGWRDWWTLLHPPYTLWHLSYVAMGAATAREVDLYRLGMSLLGFFLGVGLAAHALDELRGRPLGTSIPDRVLQGLAIVALVGAAAVGIVGIVQVSAWLAVFIVVGAFLVVGYNLELLDGRFHSDLWFAIAWGGFPALTGAFAQDGSVDVAAVLVAGACVAISGAQRVLSTPVRALRRRVATVEETITLLDGTTEPVGADLIKTAPEAALKFLSLAMPLLATALVSRGSRLWLTAERCHGAGVRSIRAVSALHRVIGFAVVATFALGWIWGLGAKIARRDPGDGYWTWLAVAQVVAGAQALLGTILLLDGRRLETGGVLGGTLHYVYGYLPLLLFVFAHVVARAGDARAVGMDRPVKPWVPFAWASFISFGLTLRALMTGLGL